MEGNYVPTLGQVGVSGEALQGVTPSFHLSNEQFREDKPLPNPCLFEVRNVSHSSSNSRIDDQHSVIRTLVNASQCFRRNGSAL